MKRILYFVSFILLSSVLAGCISIPVGDNVLEISTNGIEFVEKEDGKELVDNDTNEESEEVDQESNVEEDEAVNDTEEQNNNESNVDASVNDCEEQDHSAVTEDLKDGFYIPDCAELTKVSKGKNNLDAYFTVEGEWQEIFSAYKEFFGNKLESERQNPADGNGELNAYLYEDTDAYTEIQIVQNDENVSLRIIQYFPEAE